MAPDTRARETPEKGHWLWCHKKTAVWHQETAVSCKKGKTREGDPHGTAVCVEETVVWGKESGASGASNFHHQAHQARFCAQ